MGSTPTPGTTFVPLRDLQGFVPQQFVYAVDIHAVHHQARGARIEPRDRIPVEPDSVERIPQTQHYLIGRREHSIIAPMGCGRNFGRNATEWLDRCVGWNTTTKARSHETRPPAPTTIIPSCQPASFQCRPARAGCRSARNTQHRARAGPRSFPELGPDRRPAWGFRGRVQTQDPIPPCTLHAGTL